MILQNHLKAKTAKQFKSRNSNSITVDSISFEAQDDKTALGTGSSAFDLGVRGTGTPTIRVQSIGNDLEIITRSGRVVFLQ